MSKTGSYDGLAMGIALGLIVIEPSIGSFIRDTLDSVIPTAWRIFGDFSLTVFSIGIFGILGYIFDRTR